tara:strand:+ start:166 stop:546 length:381 start_codon:yes stop_codon:yes gene_type:complete
MSTIFAVLKKERDAFGNVTNVKRYDIAHRHGIGSGKVGIKWLSINVLDAITILNGCTDKTQIKVHAMDNTAQGVDKIGDLITLDKHGTLYRKPAPKKKPAVKAVKYNMIDYYKKLNKQQGDKNNEK